MPQVYTSPNQGGENREMNDNNGKLHPAYSREGDMLTEDIREREDKYPPALQCQRCKRKCKVHLPPRVEFVCYREEK